MVKFSDRCGMVIVMDYRRGEMGSYCLISTEIQFCKMEKCWKLMKTYSA